jgi:tetratricopeptide (TPR) repeat protein
MESALEKKGVRHPEAWLRRTKGNLDQALAEAVTLAVDDVLLDRLLEKLEGVPLAKELLLGASVYRIPVNFLGLAWQVGEEIEIPGDRERRERLTEMNREFNRASGRGEEPSPEILGKYEAETPDWRRPPLAVPEGVAEAMAVLGSLGLLAPVQWDDTPEETRFAVHRWTATAVVRRSASKAIRQAHFRAAQHWRWRAERFSQSRQNYIAQLFEALHHYRVTGDVDQAAVTAQLICGWLDFWGEYRKEEQVCRDALVWLPERSAYAAAFLHQIGLLSQRRGNYYQAYCRYNESLSIYEDLGARFNSGKSYHQLGNLAYLQGAYSRALDWYKKAIDVFVDIQYSEGIASSYRQIGTIYLLLDENVDQALLFYRLSLRIEEGLGSRIGMANSYHHLGVAAQFKGDHRDAQHWLAEAFKIFEDLNNKEGLARSYHQLGMLGEQVENFDQALERYKKSIQIREGMGDRLGLASSYCQLGVLTTRLGQTEEGLRLTLLGWAIQLEFGMPEARKSLYWLSRQRKLLGEERFTKLLREHAHEGTAEALLKWFDQPEEEGH